MNTLLSIETRNAVLLKMAILLERERTAIIEINKADLEAYEPFFKQIRSKKGETNG